MSHREVGGLALLLLAAMGLRLWGFEQGYPEMYGHVDEVGVAASIWNFFRAETLLPTEFTYPTFYSYLTASSLYLSVLLGWGPRQGSALETLVLLSYLDPARVALVGRVLSALLGTATVYFTFYLGRTVYDRSVGWLAASFMALAMVPVQQAHNALPDTAMAFFAVLTFCGAWKVFAVGSGYSYLAAGAAAGLVLASKYNGAFAALAIPVAHVMRRGWSWQVLWNGKLWAAIAAAFTALFVGSPYLFLTPEKYWLLAQYQFSSLDFSLHQSLQEVNNILVRMRELSVQSASSTISDSNRESLSAEFTQLRSEIDRIAETTTYNKQSLLSGFGNNVSTAASTAITTSNATGVTGVTLAAVQAGTYSFVDNSGDGTVTLGNGATSQTLNMGTLLDNGSVATGSTIVANFDRLGIQVSLAGVGAPGAPGSFADGDLNGTSIVVDGGTGGVFQVGPTAGAVNRIELGIGDLRASGAKMNLNNISIETLGNARGSISTIDRAITNVANERGKMGAVQNRLSFAIGYTENEIESIQASEATIRDADVALEVSEYSRSQILLQSGNAMLSQANVNAVSALSLL